MGLAKDIIKDNKKILLLVLALCVLSVVGVFLLNQNVLTPTSTIIEPSRLYNRPENVIQEGVDYGAIIKTEYGDIQLDLYEDQSPNAVNSFLFLAGEDFYDGLTFHRVIRNFVVQAGDHIGDGNGDPGYALDLDVNNLTVREYSVCMANASQFFIVPQGADLSQLQDYPIIGEVTSGYSVVDAIEKVTVDKDFKPQNNIVISSILITEK
jgi:cyclophilin family peptidyl-prolyl cis-trans isomerase